jgi:hypothetical protein
MTTVLHIYKAPSGQWSGKFLQDGLELGRVAGCAFAQDVEDAASDSGIEFDAIAYESAEIIRSMLELCRVKGWSDPVRILDHSEVMGTPWGKSCTMQVMDYITGEWVSYSPDGKSIFSLTHCYGLIRSELAWGGPVRLAAAEK